MIGLGLMGEAMARRLIETGHAVAGCDIAAKKVAVAAAFGVHASLRMVRKKGRLSAIGRPPRSTLVGSG
jgi:3-hydroxyisobutyrate dehydrogenase-like beta-hydroxyacid dehydrogenase